MRIQEIMSRRVHSVTTDTAAEDAWQIMQTKGIRHVVVKDGEQTMGVLSESDAGGRNGAPIRMGATVRDLMNAEVVTVSPTDPVKKAANLMKNHGVACVAVIDRGRLVGVVTVADLLTVLGGGADRPAVRARRPLHHRVAHRKARTATGRW